MVVLGEQRYLNLSILSVFEKFIFYLSVLVCVLPVCKRILKYQACNSELQKPKFVQ